MGAIALACIIAFMPVLPPAERRDLNWKEIFQQLDPIGTVVLVPAVISLLLAIQWGGTKYAWDDGRIIALFVLSGVLTITFFTIQLWRKGKATIPLSIAKDHNILGAIWFSVCVGCTLTVFTYYVCPLF
jgi:hypothetical protein